jgi:hypothetical protein
MKGSTPICGDSRRDGKTRRLFGRKNQEFAPDRRSEFSLDIGQISAESLQPPLEFLDVKGTGVAVAPGGQRGGVFLRAQRIKELVFGLHRATSIPGEQ